MAESPHLGLPFLEAGQAQKHVTHNESLRILDALVQLSVTAISSSPPGSPEDGERHIVAGSASGAFVSKDNKVAVYEDGAWRFLTPHIGWRAWNEDEEALLVWSGTEWIALETGGGGGGFDPDDVEHLYLNDAAPGDADVKFAMRGEAALLHAIPAAESGDGDVRLQISKETSGNTASAFFSTSFSGRAEFGLVGSDNFKLKVSADGSSWTEALDIDKSTGRLRLPPALALTDADQAVAKRHIRECLFANRTYYVRTDGSNSNDGLANNSGGAFLTLQKAIDTAAALDISIYTVTISVADGTYTGGVTVTGPWVGSGTVQIVGNTTTPANCIISTTGSCFSVVTGARLYINGFELRSSGAQGIFVSSKGHADLGNNMRFGAIAAFGLNAIGYGTIDCGNFTYAGSGQGFAYAEGGQIDLRSCACTVSGTIAMSAAFAYCLTGGSILAAGFTHSGGTPTGSRFYIDLGGIIDMVGGVTFPGSVNGTTGTSTGGGFKR